ncbi:MAG: ThuA domain-containing protein [Rubripirellula sp.]|jgi:type 1 glutamine amidotransferase|nr:ThuA domain-containing protein [Rubripirellula sp.]
MPRLLCTLTMALLLPSILFAQNEKKPRFKPIPDQAREAITKAVPDTATAKPKKDRRVLVFSRCGGFVHQSIPFGNFAVQTLGDKTDAFSVDLADTYDVFTPENLAKYDCILLNNTTHMQFPDPAQLNAFLDFISKGKGLAGFHAASDNFGRHPEALAMVGGIFNGHPWGGGGTWAFKLDDPGHALNQAFGGKGFWHQDEIYQYKPESYVGPEKLRVLVSLDMSKNEVSDRIKDGPREVPVSWVRKAGDGRVFYTNFGHRAETFQNPVILKHMLDGIQYAIGDLEIDDAPTAKAPTTPVLAPEKK